MGSEFLRLSERLSKQGHTEASSRTLELRAELLTKKLIPDRLDGEPREIPDLSYMNNITEERTVATGNFGEQVKKYRRELGLTLGMFGELLGGKSASTLSRLESEHERASLTTALNVVHALM